MADPPDDYNSRPREHYWSVGTYAGAKASLSRQREQMRIIHYGSDLVQLTRYPAIFPMNCHLVREDDGLTLVDSMMSSPAAEVERILGQLEL